jgi:hypothetical protein
MGTNPRIVRGFDLHEKLKEYKPAIVHAYDDNDEKVTINVPDVRQRHARVLVALKEVAWIRCDLLDKKGGLLHRHNRCADDLDQPAGELEEIRSSSRTNAEMQGMLSIMLRAQEVALIRHQQGIQQILDANNRLLDSTLKRLEMQEAQLQQAMQMNHALSGDLVNAQLQQLQLISGPEVDDDGNQKPQTNSDRALQAFLPAFLRSAMEPGTKKPAQPTNGASEKVPSPPSKERQAPSTNARPE